MVATTKSSQMTTAELIEELGHYKFMPDWSFEIIENVQGWTFGGLALRIRAIVKDSRGSGNHIRIATHCLVPSFLTRQTFPAWLLRCVEQAMIHEAQEWLRRDGKLVLDPHAYTYRAGTQLSDRAE